MPAGALPGRVAMEEETLDRTQEGLSRQGERRSAASSTTGGVKMKEAALLAKMKELAAANDEIAIGEHEAAEVPVDRMKKEGEEFDKQYGFRQFEGKDFSSTFCPPP